MQDWYSFKGETKEFYSIDMSVLEVGRGVLSGFVFRASG